MSHSTWPSYDFVVFLLQRCLILCKSDQPFMHMQSSVHPSVHCGPLMLATVLAKVIVDEACQCRELETMVA